MHEFKDVWDSVVVRLVDIYTYLQQEWAADATSIPQNIGRRFVRILVRFTGLKVVCEEANIFVRLVASRKIVSSIQDFHAEIDHLLRRLERDWSEPMHSEWLGRLSDEQSAIMERFETEAQDENLLASELEEDTTQVEALCLLEYEKQEHSDIYNQGHLDLLELFLEKILQFVGDAESVPEWFIPSHEITIGPQSSVYEPHNRLYRGTWLNSNVLISKCDAAQDRFVEACSVWVQLSHPNVISLFGAYHLRAPYLAVFENVSSTSLMDFLAAEGNQRGMWQKMYEVALGLGYLHERKIVLGDLRCDDIWIDKDGLAMIPGSAFEERSVDSDGMAMQWLPPEVMRGEEPSLASDVYAFGICIVEAVAGKSPWPDWTEYSVYSDTKAEFLPARPDAMDRHQWYLIQSMCRFDPSERVSMAFATEHLKFFAIQESSQAEETPALSGGVCCNLRAYIVPELSSSIEAALENLEARCSMASDACDLALHVHARLVNVFELLQEMHKLPRDVEVTKFCDVLVMLYTFLRAAISETSVIERAKSRKVSLKANVLHREVDALLGLLSFDVIDPVHSWTPKLAVSAVTRLGTVNESPDDEEKTDEPRTVKLLRFEAKHLNRRYDAIDIEMLNTLIAEGDRPPWFIPIHELRYQREDSVGTGAFGAVYRGMWLGTSVVVKFMGYEDDTDTENLEMFFHELRVWHPLHHPHVVRLFGACHLGKRFFVCEYATNGTLYDFLQRDENRERTWKRLYELALGLQYLHKENIVHNDLKCDNFLVGSDGKAKISDFGLSCIPNSAEVKIDPKLQGAQQWKSPEYLRGDRLRLASDIYSFGMCILEAVTGAAPWGRMLDVFVRMKVRKSLLPPRPESMSDEQFNLVEMMCTPDPVHRLQIASVVERLDEFSQESKRCTSRSRFRRLKSYAPS
ncbi:Tkl protein kinase [Globisporangium polare]